MIGVESSNNAKLFYNFSLEKKVRKNHPLRKLKEIRPLCLPNRIFPENGGHIRIQCIEDSFKSFYDFGIKMPAGIGNNFLSHD
jgi:hypothetical protein